MAGAGVALALLFASCGKSKTDAAPDTVSESAVTDAGAATAARPGKPAGSARTGGATPSPDAGGGKPDYPDAGCTAAEGEQPEGVCATLQPSTPRCGDGIIDPASEQCDGSALPPTAPAGSSCSATCTVLFPSDPNGSACANCAAQNCFSQRADLDTVLPLAEPLMECVLGANWQLGARASAESCANGDLLSGCFCGSVPTAECETSSPSEVDGPCAALILAATGCSTDGADAGANSCVARSFVNPGNQNGKVMQYVQCRQDLCYDDCLNP